VVSLTPHVPLDALPVRAQRRIVSIRPPAGQAQIAQQLGDLGFLVGESVRLLRHGPFGGDPILVRVGGATYALRRAEAQCIEVEQAP
jgi:ferrous iron transport protein A